MLRQMRRWAIEQSPQGPVYLGYRLGHIKGDGRVFRALVYNKGAMVLHMLRRLVGDEAFFAGLRQFYATWQFRKAGTDDFRVAMEKASGRDLTRVLRRLDLRHRRSACSGSRHTVAGGERDGPVRARGAVDSDPGDGHRSTYADGQHARTWSSRDRAGRRTRRSR